MLRAHARRQSVMVFHENVYRTIMRKIMGKYSEKRLTPLISKWYSELTPQNPKKPVIKIRPENNRSWNQKVIVENKA